MHQNESKTFLSLPTSSELSYKCQTKVQERFRLFWQVPDTSEEFLQTKVEFWVAIMFCFFWIFIEFYQVPDYSGKCQTKGFRLVWQMPDSSEHFFWHVHMCQTQLKNLGGNKSMFYVILNQFYKCQTKLQNKNPCYLLLKSNQTYNCKQKKKAFTN